MSAERRLRARILCHTDTWYESDEEFQSTYKSARAAVSEFMAAVGAQILRDGAYR
jgi:hypothetical protein